MVTELREIRVGIEARLGALRRGWASWAVSRRVVLAIHAVTDRVVVVEWSATLGEPVVEREFEAEEYQFGGCGEGVGVESVKIDWLEGDSRRLGEHVGEDRKRVRVV